MRDVDSLILGAKRRRAALEAEFARIERSRISAEELRSMEEAAVARVVIHSGLSVTEREGRENHLDDSLTRALVQCLSAIRGEVRLADVMTNVIADLSQLEAFHSQHSSDEIRAAYGEFVLAAFNFQATRWNWILQRTRSDSDH